MQAGPTARQHASVAERASELIAADPTIGLLGLLRPDELHEMLAPRPLIILTPPTLAASAGAAATPIDDAAQRRAERRAAERLAAEQRVAEQRVAEQRAAERRAAERRAAEQRAAERRAAERHAANEKRARAAARAWNIAPTVTWYGSDFFGNRTACGQRYTRKIIGVAHKTLPCGTLVQFRWHGITATAPVIDRGPYGPPGYVFDFSAALSCDVFKERGVKNACFTRHNVAWRIVGRR